MRIRYSPRPGKVGAYGDLKGRKNALVLTVGCANATAWGCDGHRAVVFIAERLLPAATLASAKSTLSAAPVDPALLLRVVAVGDEGVEDTAQTVIDVVHSFRLTNTQFDKKAYLQHLKGYMKAVKEKLKERGAGEDEVKAFESGSQTMAKKIVGGIKDYEFFIGESMDPDGM